tara:strand:+ start:1575 stop:1874 length:300 start_codon:yes stop_codon:yes gene_type:complete
MAVEVTENSNVAIITENNSNAVVYTTNIGGVDTSVLDTLIDTVGTLTYIGKSSAGAIESEAVWQVKRVEDLGGGDVNIRFANGSASFVAIWDNRAAFTY